MAKRLVIFLTAIALIVAYLALRLSAGVPAPESTVIIACTLVLLVGIFLFPLSFRNRNSPLPPTRLAVIQRWIIYMDMGYLSFLGALVVLRDLIGLPFVWWRPQWRETIFSAQASCALFALAAVFLIIGVRQAALAPRLKRVNIPIDDLPGEFEGFTIAQISDLHLSTSVTTAQVDRVVNLVNDAQPDLLTLTGDIGDGNPELLQPLIERLKALRMPRLYITGNHEYYWNAPAWVAAFEKTGMKALLNARELIERGGSRLLIAGVVDPAARMIGSEPDLAQALGAPLPTAAKILLAHHPGMAHEAAAAGFDLQLSGHTHAGQFFPWTLIVGRVHEFAKGLDRAGRMWVYVNPGTGSWGPPIRLGSRTEITLLTLSKST